MGKGGVTDSVIEEAERQLLANELIKGRVLEASLLDPREACDAICSRTGADGVQIVGTKFVLYRKSEKPEAKPVKKTPAKRNPVKEGVRARKQAARKKREARKEYFHEAAVKAAIEKRRGKMEENG